MDELHKVLHELPDYLKAVVLELMDRPMSRQEMRTYIQKLGRRLPRFGRKELPKVNLDDDIVLAIEKGVVQEKAGKLCLSPGGREIAEHMEQVIPYFVNAVFSPRMVSIVTIAVHILLSILKLFFGLISGFAGLLMLALSAYQYIAGRRNSNFAIMCQSVDSRNHVFTSLLVCGGIVLSFFAERFNVFSLYYADAAASIAIGFLIPKSAIELGIELAKPEGEAPRVSHFMGTAQERMRASAVWRWLSEQLREGPLTYHELKARFTEEFCGESPKILLLAGVG